MAANKHAPLKAKLRWYQFSLRSLFILVTLVAVVCSWFAVKMEQARKQHLAVEEITKLGGRVYYNYSNIYHDDGSQLTNIVLQDGKCITEQNPAPRVPAWLRKWLGDDFFYDVVSLEIADSKALDAVEKFEKCTDLELHNITIDDTIFNRLGTFGQLRKICFIDSEIEDDFIEKLRKRMPDCEISTYRTHRTYATEFFG